MADEWGPWIEHDGRGLPVQRGTIVESMERCGVSNVHPAHGVRPEGAGGDWDCWLWPSKRWTDDYDIIRYRIKRPRGMEIIDKVLKEVEADLATQGS